MKSSEHLELGSIYTRAELAAKFDIKDATLNNGIFKPKDHDSVWLFVTQDKTSDRTQYRDLLDGDVLTMDGQTKGRTDHLLINYIEYGLELVLFYRLSRHEHPGAGFVYQGVFNYEGHTGQRPAHFTLRRPGKYKYGSKRAWELVLDAIDVIGDSRNAKPSNLLREVQSKHPSYNKNNLGPDLTMLSVNDKNRVAYTQNAKPRRSDAGSEFDRLFKVGSGKGVVYERYDPKQHGVWEIYADEASSTRLKMSVRRVQDPVAVDLASAMEQANASGAFDPNDESDARKRVLGTIVRRRGQPAFRAALLDAYESACAITGCTFLPVLEAAHIFPYQGDHTNVASNGLLLRADIHTLFDLRLLSVDPKDFTVQISQELCGTEYEALNGKPLRRPQVAANCPSPAALEWHRSRCGWPSDE